MDNQSTKINDLPGGKIEDDEIFDPTFYSENDQLQQQQLHQRDQELEQFQQERLDDSRTIEPSIKKEKSLFEEDFVLLMILLYIRTLPITNNLTHEIPFIGNYVRHNNLLTTIISCGLLALLYIVCKKYLN